MPVTTKCTLTVGIADLQHAIDAVACHAEKAKQGDEQAITCRVRLIAGKTHLVVTATDGRTTGVAWLPILADSRTGKFSPEDGAFIVDLYPKGARAIADALTPITQDGEGIGDAVLVLSSDEATIRDKSGKYPGTSHTEKPIEQEATATLDGTEHLGYPDVLARMRDAFVRGASVIRPLLPPARALARFEVAAAQYRQPLVIEQVGDGDATAWLVWCGTSFAGVLDARREDDSEIRRRSSRRLVFLRHLGALSAEDEARLELGGALDDAGDQDEDDEGQGDAGRAPGEDEDGFYDADNDPTASEQDDEDGSDG